MKISRRTLKNWLVKILVLLIVIAMVLTGFVAVFWK